MPEFGTPGPESPASAAPVSAGVVVRRFLTGDSIPAITALLHKAYAPQVAMGLAPLAGRQSDAITLDRVLNSECYLAFDHAWTHPDSSQLASAHPGSAHPGSADPDCSEDGRLVGVILLNEHEKVSFPPIFMRKDTSHFAMFGVDPACQGRGVGKLLLDAITARALDLGAVELALSMAEPDTRLRAFYERLGFGFVQHWQWPYTNYRSVILSRPVTR